MACRPVAYSECIASMVAGEPQWGVVHSAFDGAANILFPGACMLSLNACASPRMPNGLHLSAQAGTFPFSMLRAGMQVLLGAQHLHIEVIGCSLDLSQVAQWDPHIYQYGCMVTEIIMRNAERLHDLVDEESWRGGMICRGDDKQGDRVVGGQEEPKGSSLHLTVPGDVLATPVTLARYLCGRGVGLTPAGDDMLAGWMAAGWLMYGPLPWFLDACQSIVAVAMQQTHVLSQAWLRCAASGNVALPVVALLEALTRQDAAQLDRAARGVLAMGATSGRDLIRGMLLCLRPELHRQAQVS